MRKLQGQREFTPSQQTGARLVPKPPLTPGVWVHTPTPLRARTRKGTGATPVSPNLLFYSVPHFSYHSRKKKKKAIDIISYYEFVLYLAMFMILASFFFCNFYVVVKYIIKCTILTICSIVTSVALKTFTILCHHHHHPSPEFLSSPNSVRIEHCLPTPSPALAPTLPDFLSLRYSGTSRRGSTQCLSSGVRLVSLSITSPGFPRAAACDGRPPSSRLRNTLAPLCS